MNVDDIGERQIKTPVRALMIGRGDNVALLLSNVKAGEVIMLSSGRAEIAREDIPAGYKVAARAVKAGQPVITSNQVIGTAVRLILPGERVHFHNFSD